MNKNAHPPRLPCRPPRAARRLTLLSSLMLLWAGDSFAITPQPGRLEPPKPLYEVEVTKELWIPMRDGVRLAADLYRPKGLPGRLPVILIRTPYSKDLWPPRD